MSKMAITIFLFLFMTLSVNSAFLFVESESDYITIADNATLTIPDGDWSAGGWVKLTSNAGTNENLLLDNYAGGTTWWEWIIYETSHANSDDFFWDSADDDGTTASVLTTSNPFLSNTAWTHVMVVRSGTTMTVYIDGTSAGSTSVSAYDASNGGDWVMGRWAGGDPDGYLDGNLAEWAKWDRALNADERAALAKGFAPSFFPHNLKFYVSMIRQYSECMNDLTITNTGSAVSTHPPILYPN